MKHFMRISNSRNIRWRTKDNLLPEIVEKNIETIKEAGANVAESWTVVCMQYARIVSNLLRDTSLRSTTALIKQFVSRLLNGLVLL